MKGSNVADNVTLSRAEAELALAIVQRGTAQWPWLKNDREGHLLAKTLNDQIPA
jgi:hypothetical protein